MNWSSRPRSGITSPNGHELPLDVLLDRPAARQPELAGVAQRIVEHRADQDRPVDGVDGARRCSGRSAADSLGSMSVEFSGQITMAGAGRRPAGDLARERDRRRRVIRGDPGGAQLIRQVPGVRHVALHGGDDGGRPRPGRRSPDQVARQRHGRGEHGDDRRHGRRARVARAASARQPGAGRAERGDRGRRRPLRPARAGRSAAAGRRSPPSRPSAPRPGSSPAVPTGTRPTGTGRAPPPAATHQPATASGQARSRSSGGSARASTAKMTASTTASVTQAYQATLTSHDSSAREEHRAAGQRRPRRWPGGPFATRPASAARGRRWPAARSRPAGTHRPGPARPRTPAASDHQRVRPGQPLRPGAIAGLALGRGRCLVARRVSPRPARWRRVGRTVALARWPLAPPRPFALAGAAWSRGGAGVVWPGSAGLPERAAARLSYNRYSGWLVAENSAVAASVSARAAAE